MYMNTTNENLRNEGVPLGPSRCGRCGVECVADPSFPNRWTCPRCGGKLIFVECNQQIEFRDEWGVYGTSEGTFGGLPARESTRHVSKLGHASGTDVERAEDGQSKVLRMLRPSGPTPRDPAGLQKEREQIEAVQKMLQAYNRLHGTHYLELITGVDLDSRGEDVVAKSQHGEPPIVFQLTFIDTEGRLWASVSKGRPYDAKSSEEALLARFAKALKEKAKAPDSDRILVLDGRGVYTPQGMIERFVRDYRSDLTAAPFREVWYVDHAPGGFVNRIWPPAPATEP